MAVKKDSSKTTATGGADRPDLEKFLGEVQQKAFEIYQDRMKSGKPGDGLSDWLLAETEIRKAHKL